jgi:hypothetical protein
MFIFSYVSSFVKAKTAKGKIRQKGVAGNVVNLSPSQALELKTGLALFLP